jgi:hypothetical protein
MFRPSLKPTAFNAIALGKEIVRSVHAAMPIGSENIKQDPQGGLSSHERTGAWGRTTVDAAQRGSLHWDYVETDNKATWRSVRSSKREYPIVPTDEDEDEDLLNVVERALAATMFKAGNCQEMTALAMIRFCQWFAALPPNTPTPEFYIKIMYGTDVVIDHAFLKVCINDQHVLCDPWLKSVFDINDTTLNAWKTQFENTEDPPIAKERVSKKDQADIWAGFLETVKRREGIENVEFMVSSRETAIKIADLYERSLQEAVLSLYNEELFDVRNMSSSLLWHNEPVQMYLMRHHQEASPNFYVRKNIEAIKLFIEQYQFPEKIIQDELLEHIHLYVYLFANNEFRHKPTIDHFASVLTKYSCKTLCKIACVPSDGFESLKIYAAQVLVRYPSAGNDARAIALKEAWLQNSVVDLCDALKMNADDWDAMPKELKNYAEKLLEHKHQNKI